MVHTKILQSETSRTILTVSEKSEREPEKFRQFLASILATLSALSLGMCLVWTSPALPLLEKPNSHIKITKEDGAWIGSLITLGACIGAIPTGTITNLIGRKRTLQVLAIPLLISWIMIAFSNCLYLIFAARFLAGLTIGSISVSAPMYVAEIAHTSIRGTLGTFFQVLLTIGVLLEYILGGIITSFQSLALASAAFPLLFLLTFSFMPETPVFLYSKNRLDQARKSLEFFRGSNYNLEDEMLKIADDIKQSTANKVKLSDLLRSRATIYGLIIAMGLMVCQQISGINAVLFYAATIFAESGSGMAPDTSAILVGIVQVIATMLSTFLIDKTGRKILLFLSSFIMCFSLLVLGIYFHLKQSEDLSHFTFVPLASLTIFIIMFSLGFGPIPWIMLGEIFTPQTKGVASSVSAAFNWILAFTVTNQFQNMNEWFGVGITFIFFGWVCGMGALFVALLVPETKGKDVEEVQKMLGRKKVLDCRSDTQTTVV